ncbi:MAG: hypothetical protein J6Y80_06915, partial [Victivallales bacterium]|nr:hypothetical protein [Victivallales bacterium]
MAINTALQNAFFGNATLSVASEVLSEEVASRELSPQLVYLDFDGAQTAYRNRDLDLAVENVSVEASGFGAATISAIVADLNAQFAGAAVFTAEEPSSDSYSTIYIGVTSAFEGLGEFYGLAETVDSGNRIADDNAFVLLNSQASAALVTSVIAHEAGHLLGTLDHGGEGLDAYAAGKGSTSTSSSVIRVNSGATRVVSTSEYAPCVSVGESPEIKYLFQVYGHLHVASGGSVNNVQVYSNGIASVTSWGTIGSDTYLSGGPGGTQISGVQVYSGGSLYLSKGLAYNIVVERGGSATLIKPWAKIVGIVASGTVDLGVSARVSAVTIGMGGNVILNGDNAAASGVTVNSGAVFQVVNGSAVEVLENGGAVSISDGGAVDWLPNTMALVTVPTGRWTTVHEKTIIKSATLSGGSLDVYYAGQVYNATLNAGRMTVNGGGQAGGVFSSGNGTVSGQVTACNGAHLTIAAQGAATVFEDGGYVDVLSGANVEFIPNAISSSYSYSVSGSGTLHSSTSALGTVTLSGYQNHLHIIGGYAAKVETRKTISNYQGNQVAVVSGGSIGVIDLQGKGYYGYYDGVLSRFISGGTINITPDNNSGNTSSSTEVDLPGTGGDAGNAGQGGTMTSSGTASSAATAWNSATISSAIHADQLRWPGTSNWQDHTKEALLIGSGCIVSSAELRGDTITYVEGGRLQSATGSRNYNAVIVSASGVALNLAFDGHYNAVQVLGGGVVTNVKIDDKGAFARQETGSGRLYAGDDNGGGLGVYTDGRATNVTQSGGRVLVGGGEVVGAKLNKVGIVRVYGNAGYLADAQVYNFGDMAVTGGMVESTVLNNGSSLSLTNGTFASVELANVKLDMHAAGVLRDVTVSSGAEVVLTRSNLVDGSGVVLGSTVVLAGELKIHAGGKMQITEADLENGNGDLDDLSIQARDVALELELGNGYTGGIGLYDQYQELQSISVSNPNRVTGDFTLASQATKFYADDRTVTVKVDGISSLTLQAERYEKDKKPTFYTAADGLQYALTLMPTYWHDEPEPEEHADLVLKVEGKGAAPAEQEEKGLNISVKSANRKEVTLTVTLREDDLWTTVAGIFYSVDGNEYTPMESLTWDTENGKVFGDYTATANGTVHFRAEYFDSSRNMVKDYEVTGISGTTPHNPDDPDNPPYNPDDPYDPSNPDAIIHVTADVTAPTNGKVTLTAVYEEGSVVQQYRDPATGEWMGYDGPVEVSKNGAVYFRMQYEDGSWSKPVRYQVGNIDTVAPVVQLLGGDNTTAGLERTTVRAVTENGLDIYYCADYEGEWRKQTGEVEVTLNGTYRFRATDAAGNIGEAEITFANLAENGL